MKRLKKKKKRKQPLHPKVRCPNCGEFGTHFVPPSFGDKGFFICEPKAKNNKPLNSEREKAESNAQSSKQINKMSAPG